jgi:hypothetical protein
MKLERNTTMGLVHYPSAERIGLAKLTKMAFDGVDLLPLRSQLISKLLAGLAGAGEGLDLSLIMQLLGDKPSGMALQAEVLAQQQLYRSPSARQPKLRVLALAAAIDMGGNTPIEFLLEDSDIELQTLYVIDGIDLPAPLPEHDVAIVIASDSEECVEALRRIDAMASNWPRPLLNAPRLVRRLDRDKLHRLLRGIDGLDIPATVSASRAQLSEVSRSNAELADIAEELQFPLIVRPRGSHAGVGLVKVDAFRRLRQSGRHVPQIPNRVCRWPSLRLPHGHRRSLGHLVRQRRHGIQRRKAARRRTLHARLRNRFCRAPPQYACSDRCACGAGLFHH